MRPSGGLQIWDAPCCTLGNYVHSNQVHHTTGLRTDVLLMRTDIYRALSMLQALDAASVKSCVSKFNKYLQIIWVISESHLDASGGVKKIFKTPSFLSGTLGFSKDVKTRTQLGYKPNNGYMNEKLCNGELQRQARGLCFGNRRQLINIRYAEIKSNFE